MTNPLSVGESIHPVLGLVPPRSVLLWNLLALLLALIAVAGSLWSSLGMGLQACPLCYYQRSFVMGAAAILLLAQMTEFRGSAVVSVLAMPVAIAGLAIACYHVSRELAGKMECPAGLWGLGTVPKQSLAVQSVLVILLLIAGIRRPVVVVGIVVGSLLAYACVQSVAPVAKPSPAEYEKPPVICRPPA
jgi:Disulfide bond formation protein DsbB